MEFLGVGYQEILVILVLMLVVVGPERLPRVAYQVGRAVRTMQSYARVVRDEFSDEMKYFEQEVSTIRGEVDSTRTMLREADAELKQQQQSFESDVRATTRSVNDATKSVNESIAASDSKVVSLPLREKPAARAAANGSRAAGGSASATPKKADGSATGSTADTEKTEPPAPPLVF